MQAVRVHQFGGREAMQVEDIPQPQPGAGEVLIEIEAAGINFIDVYQRTGTYPNPLPYGLGMEGAGVVRQVGPDVGEFREGDRVAWSTVAGSYAEFVVAPVAKIVPVPDGVTSQQAAALMLQGMTAHYLTHSTYPVQQGDRVLVHAAAGGTGQLIVQMAKRRGATVYGTVSTAEKAQIAREAGADEVIRYTEQDFEAEVKRLTDGKGVHVVYDGVGKTTFDKGLNSLRPRGYMVLFGQASGPVEPINPQVLNAKGSLFLTRPTLFHYVAERHELLERAADVLGMAASGALNVRIDHAYPLAEVAAAHEHLEGRGTMGKLLLVPGSNA